MNRGGTATSAPFFALSSVDFFLDIFDPLDFHFLFLEDFLGPVLDVFSLATGQLIDQRPAVVAQAGSESAHFILHQLELLL